MAKRVWPRKISITNNSLSAVNTTIIDAETGLLIDYVLKVVIELRRHEMAITLTGTTTSPPTKTLITAPDEAAGEYEMDGMVVEDHVYPVARIAVEGGV